MVSIFSRAKTLSVYRPAAYILGASALSFVTLTIAVADTVRVESCVGSGGASNCVERIGPAGDPYIRNVPEPATDADRERAAERDRKWIDRCHPTIAQDRYGVPRYHYAAWGCEFGIIE